MPASEPLIAKNKKDELIRHALLLTLICRAILEVMINACIEHEDDLGVNQMERQ